MRFVYSKYSLDGVTYLRGAAIAVVPRCTSRGVFLHVCVTVCVRRAHGRRVLYGRGGVPAAAAAARGLSTSPAPATFRVRIYAHAAPLWRGFIAHDTQPSCLIALYRDRRPGTLRNRAALYTHTHTHRIDSAVAATLYSRLEPSGAEPRETEIYII